MLEAVAPFLIGFVIAQEVLMFILHKASKKQSVLYKDLHQIAEKRMDLLEKAMRQKEKAEDKTNFYVDFSYKLLDDITDSFNITPNERSAFIQHRMKLRNEELTEYEGKTDVKETN